MTGVTLDAGALIALERSERVVLVLLARARETGAQVTVPAPVLAQVLRRPDRQVPLMRLSRQPTTDVMPFDRPDAVAVGRILATAGAADVVDAHVVLCASRAGLAVVTSDPDDLHRLDPRIQLVIV